jgi:hypothetical protein
MLRSKIFTLLLFVTLLLPLSAFATTAEEAFAEGNIAYAQKNYTQALERYSESIKIYHSLEANFDLHSVCQIPCSIDRSM